MKNAAPTITRYSLAPIGRPDEVRHGLTLAEVEQVTQVDAIEIEHAVETYGEGTTDEWRVTASPSEAKLRTVKRMASDLFKQVR